MKDKVRNGKPKCFEIDKGLGEEREQGEVGKPSLCRWPNHQPNVLVIAAIHYRTCDCLVQDQVAHLSLSAGGNVNDKTLITPLINRMIFSSMHSVPDVR